MRSVLPEDVKLTLEFDQSPYVTGAIGGVVEESVLGAILTGLMVLLFLRDWRSVRGRRADDSAGADGRRVRAVARRADDQPDDAGRPLARRRHPGR